MAARQAKGRRGLTLQLAGVHSKDAIDFAFEKRDVLLSNEHRAVLEVDCKKGFHYGYAEFWCEPKRWLIGKVKFCVGHEASADRHHSTLTAGEPSDRRLHELPQRFENVQHAFLALFTGPPSLGRKSTGVEMFLYGKPLEDLISLRHDGQALADDLMGVASRSLAAGSADLFSVEKD